MSSWLAALAVLALASPAAAAPKGKQAAAAFERGVTDYQKGNFAAASEQLAASFKLEADPETLFAWAQTELQLGRCEKAIELFEKLLEFNLPAENKKVVTGKIDECKVIIAAKPPASGKQPEKAPEKQPEQQPETAGPAGPGTPPDVDRPTAGSERSPWWKDPIGDGLVGLGVVGLGVGGFMLWSARQAEQDSMKDGLNYTQFKEKDELAEKRGKIGVIAVGVGSALVVGGIVRYVTRGGGDDKERATVTGWLSPDGGGLTAIGRF